jgi:hypothetical protein
MCDVLLPPGVNPTAVKYIYHIISYKRVMYTEEMCEETILMCRSGRWNGKRSDSTDKE